MMRDNFEPHEMEREHGVEWMCDVSRRLSCTYVALHTIKNVKKESETSVDKLHFFNLYGFLHLLYVKVTVFLSSMSGKTRTQSFGKLKPMGWTEAKLPRTHSTKKR